MKTKQKWTSWPGILRGAVFVLFSTILFPASASLDGVWVSQGYGYLFIFRDNQVSIFEHTQVSCLPSGLRAGNLVVEGSDSLPHFSVSIPGFIDASMEISQGQNDSEKWVHRTDTVTYFRITKAASLPDKCTRPSPSDLDSTYVVFVENFAEHYPFFGPNGMPWTQHVPSSVNDSTALFTHLTKLVSPLNDSHIAIVAPELEQYYFGDDSLLNLPARSAEQLSESMSASFHNVHIQTLFDDKLLYAELDNSLAYLAVRSFTGLVNKEKKTDELQQFNTVLDKIFTLFRNKKGLIVDIRNNTGGSDYLAINLASRFTEEPYVAYAKQATLNAGQQVIWTPPRQTYVNAGNRPGYFGNVILLTNHQTVSAGETFAMALMQRQPEVTRLGESTAGSFSDMLPRTLPNGWLFSLPNERYLDINGQSYDTSGIKPHVLIDDSKQQDAVLEQAIKLIQRSITRH